MHILITGGTGLIGRALIKKLTSLKVSHLKASHHKLSPHKITVLTRNIEKAQSIFPKDVHFISDLNPLDFNSIDAVINLAGEPIMGKRWSAKQKKRICDSRWDITQQLVDGIQNALVSSSSSATGSPPSVFISGSAVGYYGDQGDTLLDETCQVNAQDFAHRVCARWEEIAQQINTDKTRLCLLRTGIVLSAEGGAYEKMRLPYQLGLGGVMGDGRQYFPWIHIEDMVEGIVHLLFHPSAQGVFNFTAPNPVTQKQWSQTLAAALHRPHLFVIPSFALNVLLGEAAQLLLTGQRALPRALEKSGYVFRYTKIGNALKDLTRA